MSMAIRTRAAECRSRWVDWSARAAIFEEMALGLSRLSRESSSSKRFGVSDFDLGVLTERMRTTTDG
jgi:hypothetical protein